jgi:DNA mismatch repair protein MutH
MAPPPRTEGELVERAKAIAGRSLGEIAAGLGSTAPDSLARAKGWVGQLLERQLGASAGNTGGPDFAALGVELKTLPVDVRGVPRESTFLAVLSPAELCGARWESSRLAAKLRRVLWVPVEADPATPPAARRIGNPLLWSPDPGEERALRADWEHFAELVAAGYLDTLTGHAGQVLQVRPKAPNKAARRLAPDAEGGQSPALPRGFYLRARFTAALLARHFLLPRAAR